MNLKNINLKLKIITALVIVSCALVIFSTSSEVHASTTISRPQNNLGLVGFWNFNTGKGSDVVFDVSGNNNNGKLTNRLDLVGNYVSGRLGNGTAMTFDGTDDYVNVPTNPTTSTSNWSISAWINPTQLNDIGIAVHNGEDNATPADDGYGFGIGNGSGVAGNKLQGIHAGVAWVDSGYTFPSADRWYHVVMQRESGVTRFYVDGVRTSGTSSGAINTPTTHFRIGSQNGTRHFNGTIDEVRIYNRALSADEIKRLYNLSAPKISSVPISNGLVGYWNFEIGTRDRIAFDASGNNNTGRLVNYVNVEPSLVDSKSGLGRALDFDGSATGDRIDVGDSSSLNLGGAMSLMAWFKYDDLGGCLSVGQSCVIARKGLTSGSTHEYNLAITDDGNLTAGVVNNSGTGIQVDGSTTLSAGVWYHGAVTYDGSNIRIYLNSNLDAVPTAQTGSVYNATSDLVIGDRPQNFDRPFDGQIDEVRIYNRALTADEIKRLYNLSKPEISTVQLDKGLVGYWDFNFGKGGLLAFDRSGNNNTGRLISMDANTDWVDLKSSLGQSLDFDGSDDEVNIDSVQTNLAGSSGVTVSAWIKIDSYGVPGTAEIRQILGDDDGAAGIDGTVNFRIGSDGTAANEDLLHAHIITSSDSRDTIDGTTELQLNTWYFVSYTWQQNGRARIYINGQIDADQAAGSSAIDSTPSSGTMFIGEDHTRSRNWDGQIDDVRIYKRALSADEIKRLYLLGN